jgi:hypothetical protein
MRRAAVLTIWGHPLWIALEEDLVQAQQDAAQAIQEMGGRERRRLTVAIIGEVRALTKPSGWERAFPRERKRPASALAGIELVQRGRRSR